MKMNHYIKLGVACSMAALASGLQQFLEEDLKSDLSPENTYTSTMGFEVGSTGLYSIARAEYNTWGENGDHPQRRLPVRGNADRYRHRQNRARTAR